jgi:choline kinase
MTHRAIILAAGASRRMGELTHAAPKCLLAVGERTLLHNQLEALSAVGVTDATLVVGYREGMVREAAQRYVGDRMALSFIVNEDYAATNTLHSLWLAREVLAQGSFLLNADVFFEPKLLSRLAESPYPATLAVVNKPCGEEEVKYRCGNGGEVVELSKAVGPQLALGEAIGVSRFEAPFCEAFVESLDACIQAGRSQDFYELAIDRILPNPNVHALDISDLVAIEIDFVNDLEEARRLSAGMELKGT